jgi:phenylacetate-coenzyme A ligase PaaK-like adenylate-forming protein
MVPYDVERYRQSVRVTAQILRAHGVTATQRVAVCHPFDPWSIGGVFRDAALLCGACVLPLGLNVLSESLWSTFVEHDAAVICGSASVLLRLGEGLSKQGTLSQSHKRLIFHAGEPLPPSLRKKCAALWRAKIVDVYGSAEFDTIACEGTKCSALILAPHYRYALSTSTVRVPRRLAKGRVGELLIRSMALGHWIGTKDRVRALRLSTTCDGLWAGSWIIEHLGRLDNSIQLPDGSLVHSESVDSLARTLPIAAIQVHYYRNHKRPCLQLLVVPLQGGLILHPQLVRRALLQECFELCDAVKHEVVKVRVKVVQFWELAQTDRGKVQTFVEH